MLKDVASFFISVRISTACSTHFAYKKLLVKEMKDFVDSFFLDMTLKIHAIIKMQKRKIKGMKTEIKHRKGSKISAKHRDETPESIVSSNETVSMWTKEKQFETHQEIVQLCSDGNVSEHSQQLNFGLNRSWDSSSAVSSSLSQGNLSKYDTVESVA